MVDRKQCEFQLIRYVPDPVKNEFVNIGVLLRAADGGQSGLRFTRDWGRVRCLDPDADTEMLEGLESEIGHRLAAQAPDDPKPIRLLLEASFSNGVQITESKAYLAESFLNGLEDLMEMYVEPPRRERKQRRGGRAAISAAMRDHFRDEQVWGLMFKQFAVEQFTWRGDPLKIDCGYRNGGIKLFHAVSLETDVDEAKLLCFAAPALIEGLTKREGLEKPEEIERLLTAITEPIGWPEGEAEPQPERRDRYDYVKAILKAHKIRHKTTVDLPDLAAIAREELKV